MKNYLVSHRRFHYLRANEGVQAHQNRKQPNVESVRFHEGCAPSSRISWKWSSILSLHSCFCSCVSGVHHRMAQNGSPWFAFQLCFAPEQSAGSTSTFVKCTRWKHNCLQHSSNYIIMMSTVYGNAFRQCEFNSVGIGIHGRIITILRDDEEPKRWKIPRHSRCSFASQASGGSKATASAHVLHSKAFYARFSVCGCMCTRLKWQLKDNIMWMQCKFT